MFWNNVANEESSGESDYESGDEEKEGSHQQMTDAGMCGGHGAIILFFAAFEGFTCFWMLAVASMMILQGQPFLIVMVAFGYMFHFCTQMGLSMADPGRVTATLTSLEEGLEDSDLVGILTDLRRTRPTITVTTQAYHTTSSGSGKNRRTHTHIDHTETAEFPYASWKDVSGAIKGLDDHSVVALEVVSSFQPSDTPTGSKFTALQDRLFNVCSQYRTSVRSETVVSLGGTHPVAGSRVFVSRSPGAKTACWMSTKSYLVCRFAFPGLGTLYRVAFFMSMTNKRYSIIKQVSSRKQYGPEWYS